MADAADSTPIVSFPALTMCELGGVTVSTVDARELHLALGVGRVFGAWIADRIASYGFTAGVDYVPYAGLSVPVSESSKARQQATKEYALTLDMAKEVAMVERSEAGRRVRRYFIDCERRLREGASPGPSALSPSALPFLPGPERRVSSLHLAQALGRRHTGILRLIDVLAAEQADLIGRHIRYATYLHENGRPYRCFHLDRLGFEALMRRLPSTDGHVVALRDATLAAYGPPEIEAPAVAPPLDRDGLAVMRIAGETVTVDMLRFEPAEGERAVLIAHNGTVLLDRAVCHYPHRNWHGRRTGNALTPMLGVGQPTYPAGWVIGTVIEGRSARAMPEAGVAAPRGPRAAGPKLGAPQRRVQPALPLATTAAVGHA